MTVYIDTRGKNERIIGNLLIAKRIPTEFRHLDSADIVIENIGIERKTINDLISTLFGQKGHQLWQQIETLKNTYKKPLILLEGFRDWSDKLSTSTILGIMIGWNIPILFSSSVNQSVTILSRIFDKYGSTKTSRVPPAAVIRGRTPKEVRWAMLQCVPHIGSVMASKILEENPTIFSHKEQIVNLDIKGINKESKELLLKVILGKE